MDRAAEDRGRAFAALGPEDFAEFDFRAHFGEVFAGGFAHAGGEDGVGAGDVDDELSEGGARGEDDAEFFFDEGEGAGFD